MEYIEKIIKKLNSNTKYFSEIDKLYYDVANIMLEKLEFVKINPKNILNLGSGLGQDTNLLKQVYSHAQIFQVDIAINLLKQQKKSLFRRLIKLANTNLINANTYKLPFLDNSFDIVWSNLLLPYITNPDNFFTEIKRVLKPNGILLVSGFGVDSLSELRQYNLNTNNFPDLHVIGDILFKLGFIDPVTDVDYLYYKDNNFAKILNVIRKIGCVDISCYKNRLSKIIYQQILNDLDSSIEMKFEIFYAYAIKEDISNLQYIKINPIK
jgi:malonyl-CoA O-methyltransferase